MIVKLSLFLQRLVYTAGGGCNSPLMFFLCLNFNQCKIFRSGWLLEPSAPSYPANFATHSSCLGKQTVLRS